MNIDQLRTFQMVAKTGNFTKGGRELFLTHPAVSQHIQVLENHFPTILFQQRKPCPEGKVRDQWLCHLISKLLFQG